MTVDLLRQKRRTLSIVIDNQGKIVIKAPKLLSERKIWEFVNQKQKWIDKVLTKIENSKLESIKQSKELEVNKQIMLFGVPIASSDNTKVNIKQFYKQKLENYLLEKIPFYATKMGIDLEVIKTSLKIKEYKSKWGSCKTQKTGISFLGLNTVSKKVELTFNLKLCMFPQEIINYVIIHELSHIFQQNHSAKFWSIVSQFYQEYLAARKWLRLESSKFSLENQT